MSKNNRSHVVARFRERATNLSESAKASGEQDIAIAISRSGMFLLGAQFEAQRKGGS